MLLSSLHTGFSFLSYFNFQRFCPVLWRFLSIKGSPLFLLHGCVAFLFPSPRILPVPSEALPSPCVCINLYFSCVSLSSMSAVSAVGSHVRVGAQNVDWSRAVYCGFHGTRLGWTVSSGILTVSVFTSFHLFSLFRFPQTLLLSSLEGNSLAPFWEPRSTRGWDLQNPDCPHSLNHVFSMVHPGIELTLILQSRNPVLLSPKKTNLKSFSRLGMGSCLAVPIWGGDLVVCPRNNFLPTLSI